MKLIFATVFVFLVSLSPAFGDPAADKATKCKKLSTCDACTMDPDCLGCMDGGSLTCQVDDGTGKCSNAGSTVCPCDKLSCGSCVAESLKSKPRCSACVDSKDKSTFACSDGEKCKSGLTAAAAGYKCNCADHRTCENCAADPGCQSCQDASKKFVCEAKAKDAKCAAGNAALSPCPCDLLSCPGCLSSKNCKTCLSSDNLKYFCGATDKCSADLPLAKDGAQCLKAVLVPAPIVPTSKCGDHKTCEDCAADLKCQSCQDGSKKFVCEAKAADAKCAAGTALSPCPCDLLSCPGCLSNKNCKTCLSSDNLKYFCGATDKCDADLPLAKDDAKCPKAVLVPAPTKPTSKCGDHKTCEDCLKDKTCQSCENADKTTLCEVASKDGKCSAASATKVSECSKSGGSDKSTEAPSTTSAGGVASYSIAAFTSIFLVAHVCC